MKRKYKGWVLLQNLGQGPDFVLNDSFHARPPASASSCCRYHWNRPLDATDTNALKYNINGSPLEEVTTYRYLGVHIISNLSWKQHITLTVMLTACLGTCVVIFQWPLRWNFSRSELEFAPAVWDPFTECLISHLEAVQNRSARFILPTTSVFPVFHL